MKNAPSCRTHLYISHDQHPELLDTMKKLKLGEMVIIQLQYGYVTWRVAVGTIVHDTRAWAGINGHYKYGGKGRTKVAPDERVNVKKCVPRVGMSVIVSN